MTIREMISDAGLLAANASSQIAINEELTDANLLLMAQLDELALELLRLARQFDQT